MGLDPLAILTELLAGDSKTSFDDGLGEAMFDGPTVAVAAADDAWFARFKEVIGPFYWTPQEALSLVAPQATARSVVCWSLPVSSPARSTNRRETQVPSRAWAYVRTFGEELNSRMRHGMELHLRSLGFAAVAPAVVSQNTVAERPQVGISSCWSERHTAFVAGLGTFGLSGGLITRHGIAHRLGSVVTDADCLRLRALTATIRLPGVCGLPKEHAESVLAVARSTRLARIRQPAISWRANAITPDDQGSVCGRVWLGGNSRLWTLPDRRSLRRL